MARLAGTVSSSGLSTVRRTLRLLSSGSHLDRVVEPEPALLDEGHGADGRDRLGGGGEPEERVPTHRDGAVEAHVADHLQMLPPTLADQRDEARDTAAVNVALEGVVQAGQPDAGEGTPPDGGRADGWRPAGGRNESGSRHGAILVETHRSMQKGR
jgi:hypothetical protein